jgi:DNA-binding Xre family transcriptional regulator
MIYFIGNKQEKVVKIGYTSNSIRDRLFALSVGCPYKLEIINVIGGGLWVEKSIHTLLESKRMRGEWFNLDEAEVNEVINKITAIIDGRADESAIQLAEDYKINPEPKLKRIMRESNINQVELKKMTGLALSTINEIANGVLQNYNLITLYKICKALDKTPNDILPFEKECEL